jgi:cytochrome c peroxidase
VNLKGAVAAAFAAGAMCGWLGFAMWPSWAADDLDRIKATFRRPATIPFPADNPFSEKKRALGEALFNDKRLSADGSLACATCHNPAKAFADGRVRSKGVPGRPLGRHTPTLWNAGFAGHVLWDGRARSLEEQVVNPIQAADEMAQSLDALVERLARDRQTVRAFAEAFPDEPQVTAKNLAKAIATYVRTLVSPRTRFDRWIEGRGNLGADEIAGFRIFTGKAGCVNCHSGFAFSDYAFHDIGLPDDDRGRGAVLRLAAAEHAFKTPSLREIGRSAPYMHDGSLATIEAVLRHYENGIVERPTLSKDLRRRLDLTVQERNNLLSFLKTLTSEGARSKPASIIPGEAPPLPPVSTVDVVTQNEKAFSPTHVALAPGSRLWFLNNDTRTHNIRLFHPISISIPARKSPARRSRSRSRAKVRFWCSAGSIPRWS